MRIPPFWRARSKNGPASRALTRFRAVLEAAHSTPLYRNNSWTTDRIKSITETLATLRPLPYEQYRATFPDVVSPLQNCADTVLLPYAEARAGLRSWLKPAPSRNPYSVEEVAQATADLYHLSQAIASPPKQDWRTNHAVVAWSSLDSGILTNQQRDRLWNTYEIPLFEHLIGTDGTVIAAECEVHAGLHVRADSAILECLDGEIVFTSLTDLRHPALRVRTGLAGALESCVCDCGATEPRLTQMASSLTLDSVLESSLALA